MPIHEYRCECGHEEEKLNGETPQHCGDVMQRLISRPARFIFKGLGFYATEYGDQAYGLNAVERKQRSNRELRDRGYGPLG